MRISAWFLVVAVMASVTPAGADSADRSPRARALGVPFEGTPGPLNAITDVPGVEVGQVNLVRGEGLLKVGDGPVRTGVTMVLPRGRTSIKEVYGGFFNLNGNGEMTGQSYLQDFGLIFGPIGISNTNAVGQVYAGIMQWSQGHFRNRNLAGGVGNLGRQAERHRRLPRHLDRCHRRDRCRQGRPGRGGQCGRRHRHGLLRIQGRHRHRLARGRHRRQNLHPRRARSVQHRRPQGSAHRGRSGRSRTRRSLALLLRGRQEPEGQAAEMRR